MGKRKFFEKVKNWFVGLLVMSILVGVVVLLFVPDDSFSQISKSLNFWSRPKSSEIESLKSKILMLEKEHVKTDDAWDAIGLALTHCYLSGLAIRPEFIVDWKPEKKLKVKSEK